MPMPPEDAEAFRRRRRFRGCRHATAHAMSPSAYAAAERDEVRYADARAMPAAAATQPLHVAAA